MLVQGQKADDFYKGTWTPKLCDYNTEKASFANEGEYYDMGGITVATFKITAPSDISINTILVIKGIPVRDILGGNVFPYMASASAGLSFHNIQPRGVAGEAYIRPEITGTIATGTIIQGYFIGTTTRHLLT